jgi:hypothetical protein
MAENKNTESTEQKILEAIKSIRYGSVEVVVHDSHVVQIEKKEKVRLEKNGN